MKNKNLTLCVVSDTHVQHRKLKIPKCDVLIHCGDAEISSIERATDFFGWMGKQPAKHKIFTPGNHDSLCAYQDSMIREMAQYNGVTYLVDEWIDIEDYKFYGSPWTPTFGGWHFMKDRGEPMAQIWQNIHPDTDVLITHGPPHGIQDKVENGYSPNDGEHVGCEALRVAVDKIKPDYHFFGHIHCGAGRTKYGKTMFVNAACLDECYDLADDHRCEMWVLS